MNALERTIALLLSLAAGVLWGMLAWAGIWAALFAMLAEVIRAYVRAIASVGPIPLAVGAVVLLCVLGFAIQLEDQEESW